MALIEILILEYPTFPAYILLIFGILYFNYKLVRNYPHFHWNIFMIAAGLLGIVSLIKITRVIYPSSSLDFWASLISAMSALLFALTAYIATMSDKKWNC